MIPAPPPADELSPAQPPRPGVLGFLRQLQHRVVGDGVGAVLATGALGSTIVAVIGAGASFVVQIALARSMGQAAFGAYALTLAFMNAVLLLAKLEIDTTGVRFVGAYAAHGRWGLLRGFMRDSRAATLTMSIGCAIVSAIIIWYGRDWLISKHPALPKAMWVACLLLPVTAVLMVDAAFLQGFQSYLSSQLAPNLLRPVLVGVIILGWWAVSTTKLPPWAGVMSNLAASIVAMIFATFMLRRVTPRQLSDAPIERDRRDWILTTSPLLLVSAAQLIISQQADLIVVGTITSASQVAEYTAASQLTIPLAIVVNSITFVAQAMIADLYARGDKVALQSLIRAVTRANVAVALPVMLATIFGGKLLLGLFGPAYLSAYPVLIVLMGAKLVIALSGSLAGYLLTMTEHQTPAAWIIGGAALLNLILTLILTPIYGIMGTAVATLVAALARSVALSIFIRKEMGLRVPAF
ncbi:MAG: oligosaccharide flippase family protein [Gemmatimonadaceae bacterium]